MSTTELQPVLAPAFDLVAELLVGRVLERKLVPGKPSEPTEQVGKNGGTEAAILLGRERAETIEPVAWLDVHQVDEVARLGTSGDDVRTCSWSGVSTSWRGGAVEASRPMLDARASATRARRKLAQLLRVNVVADVGFGAFAENLFVDACAISSVAEVVRDRADHSSGCGAAARLVRWPSEARVVEVLGHRDRSRRGTNFELRIFAIARPV